MGYKTLARVANLEQTGTLINEPDWWKYSKVTKSQVYDIRIVSDPKSIEPLASGYLA